MGGQKRACCWTGANGDLFGWGFLEFEPESCIFRLFVLYYTRSSLRKRMLENAVGQDMQDDSPV